LVGKFGREQDKIYRRTTCRTSVAKSARRRRTLGFFGDFFELDPTPTGRDHTADLGASEPSYRPVYVALNDARVDGATVNIHASVYKRMAALKDSKTPYVPNPLLKDCSFQVVGPLCKALDVETAELRKLLGTVEVRASDARVINRRMKHVCTC